MQQVPAKRKAAELPFDDELTPLRVDDPRPQRVPQLPSGAARKGVRRHEEAIPTTVYDTEAEDKELPQSYDPAEVSDGGKPAFLYVERGPGAGQLVPVRQGPLVIGRASVSELRLQHPSISRRHSQLNRVGERFYIKDLGSQNGTYVNKARLATEVEIFPGDEIAVGNALLKLRGPLKEAHASQALAQQPRRRKSRKLFRVAVFAGAVGFGLAGVLAYALLRLPSTPSYQNLPAGKLATATAAAMKAEPRGAPAPVPAVRIDTEAVVRRAQEEKKVEEAVRRAMEEQRPPVESAPVVAQEPERTKEPAAATVAKSKKGSKAVVAARAAPQVKEVSEAIDEEFESDGEATPRSSKNAAALAAYEKGDTDKAISLARKANDKPLLGKLTKFKGAYDAARAAVKANNGTAAISSYSTALAIDEQLSSGWSRFGGEIRKELSGLWTLVGFLHVENDDEGAAQKAFAKAVSYDPENGKAKAQLAKQGKAKPAAEEETEGEEEKTASKPAAPQRKASARSAPASRSAIDDAFGD